MMPTMPDEDSLHPRRREALLRATLLAMLFLLVYGTCNWITSRRSDVGVIQFEWERSIPVIAWMIVPYMSIDLFFLAAPFLCRTRRELHVLVMRMALATIVAGICFLLVPLTLADQRPQLPGVFGALHDALKSGDRPHNLFPSLHVAYLLILWPHYHANLRPRGLRAASHAWFALVLLSVLFVYQHHFIDMVGGAALAVTCLYVAPDATSQRDAMRTGFIPRPVIAARYAIGAAMFLALAHFAGVWGFVAAWIALALIVIACAYAFAGPAVYRKRGGRIPIAARLLLAPHMLGLYATRRYWFRRARAPYHRIGERVLLGRLLTEREARALRNQASLVAALDLTAEHGAPRALREMAYANIPVLDLTIPTTEQLRQAVSFIQRHAANGDVYVYCGLGYSRSAMVVAAWLLMEGKAANVEAACEMIRAARPEIALGPAHVAGLTDCLS